MRRLLKQIFFASVFLGIIAGISYLLFFRVFFPPSCTDKIRNQGEEQVDCGGSCASCELKTLVAPVVRQTIFFPNPQRNTVDLAAEIRNPNLSWGAKELSYEFIILGEEQNVLARIRGTTYLLPGETRWVIAPATFSPVRVSDVQFEIQKENISWQKLKPFTEDVSLRVFNTAFRKLNLPSAFAEVRGSVQNRSSFTFGKVEINAVLYDRFDRILAVGRTIKEGLGSNQTEPFLITWPTSFEGGVNRVEVTAHTNLFSDLNFLQKYGQ